jgi:hypothetical protein
MSFVHGKGTAVSIDGDDLSAYSTSVSFGRMADSHDVTTFGKNSKVYQSGLKDGSASMEGIYDNTASTGPGAVLRALVGGAAVDFVYKPEGAGSGKPVSTVDVIVTAYDETAPVADMTTWSATLQLSDDIADTVAP